MNAHPQANGRKTSRELLFARALWFGVVAATLGLYALSVPLQAQVLQTACMDNCQYAQLTAAQLQELQQLGWSLNFYITYNIALNTIFFLIFVAVGAIIFRRKSNDWFGIYVALTLVLFGVSFSNPLLLVAKQDPAFSFLVLVLDGIGGSLISIFFYLFPDGRLVPRWTRWFIPYVVAREFGNVFFPNSPVLTPAFLVELVTLLFAQIYRYRRVSNAVERQQTKWFVYGASVGILGFATLILVGTLTSPPGQATSVVVQLIGDAGVFFFIALIPLSIMMAILRYRLWDIDIIIRRTLIYSVLTASLAFVYFGSVALLQQFVPLLTSQQHSEIVTVISTLAIAALFVPLRQRVQNVIDRRFYRRKYDAQQVLAEFAATARDETDLNRLSEQLHDVVYETMQPAHMSLWLKPVHEQPRRLSEGERG